MTGWPLVALPVLPAVGGVGLLVAAVRRARRPESARRPGAAAPIALVTAAAVLALVVVVPLRSPSVGWAFLPGGPFALAVHEPAGVVLPAVAGVAFLVLAGPPPSTSDRRPGSTG